jgi:small ubiquitin-related modifier
LKVATQDGSEVHFKIKRTTQLKKLMAAFCERQGMSLQNARFSFEGRVLQEEDTPALLEMEDHDMIDCTTQQTGGCL